MAPHQVAHYLSLSLLQKDLYSNYFVPYYEAAKKRNQFINPNKIPSNQTFWTLATSSYFGKKIVNVTRDSNADRPCRFNFKSLFETRRAFGERVMKKKDIYENLIISSEHEF